MLRSIRALTFLKVSHRIATMTLLAQPSFPVRSFQEAIAANSPTAAIVIAVAFLTIYQRSQAEEYEPIPEGQKIGHVLNRIAYGPSIADREHVHKVGISDYIEEQLHPEDIDESGNRALNDRIGDLFFDIVPGSGLYLVKKGDIWRYRKGRTAPPINWTATTFDDSAWASGPSGFGYGDDDDETELEDMERKDGQRGYLSLYVRKRFDIPDLGALDKNLFMRVQYDDAFVAYLNGKEILRRNIRGNPPAYNQVASKSEGTVDRGASDTLPLSDSARALLKQGANVLAIQVHNHELDSSDLTLIPELVHAPDPPFKAIKSVSHLQELIHLRGIHSKKQLQAVLSEFWENHFCTDFDKVEDYIDDLPVYEQLQSLGGERVVERQISAEAATAEWREYDFFYRNALGHFGDLLLYSATSPTMLIYLDNVLNVKAEPNENYAREILELYACGVDNRYTQRDIEELAKCFTGWNMRKINPAEAPQFPESARTPPTEPSQSIAKEKVLLDIGAEWKYRKGYHEPSPDRSRNPTTRWTLPNFNDAQWATGESGFGYADGDDATVLRDMQGRYVSLYLRKSFQLTIPEDYDDVVLEIAYDDGYVAYLNGAEIGRSSNVIEAGAPPRFNYVVPRNHEVDEDVDTIDLRNFGALIKPPPARNTLAIQVHNGSRDSSDLSILPRIVARNYKPGSIPITDPHGLWTFRYQPEQHHPGTKVLFKGTDQQIRIPPTLTGRNGVNDAIEVIDALVAHPSTSEFIVVKLLNRFVSDDISLESYHDRSAPSPLLKMMDDAIAAWKSTPRPGHIRTVMRAILDPEKQAGPFWTTLAYQSKIKTPIEFVNSCYRALDAIIQGEGVSQRTTEMGMDLFRRDDPDGYPEAGPDWMNTQGLLTRIRFCQSLASNGDYASGRWAPSLRMAQHKLRSAEDVLEHFNQLLFDGRLSHRRKSVILDFANTDDRGYADPVADLRGVRKMRRLQQMVGMILSTQEFQFQ